MKEIILKDKVWADSIVLFLIASMLSLRISVVRSDSCRVVCYRHEDQPIESVEIVLLFNCNMINGHYSGMMKIRGNLLQSSGNYKESQGFSKDTDKEEQARIGANIEGFRIISVGRLAELEHKELIFDSMQHVWERAGYNIVTGEHEIPTSSARRARSTKQIPSLDDVEETVEIPDGMIADSTEDEFVVAGEIQRFEQGVTVCKVCNKDYKTEYYLEHHIKKTHMNEYKYICTVPRCNSGFWSKEAFKNHELLHKTGKKIDCPHCDKKFGMKKALNLHLKWKHWDKIPGGTQPVELKCAFEDKGCSYKTTKKSYLEAHEKRCKKNENRESFTCDICKSTKLHFYSPNELKRHMKLKHGHKIKLKVVPVNRDPPEDEDDDNEDPE